MPFIDWSDPEEMIGLLAEYIADERSDTENSQRRRFLSKLLKDITQLQEDFGALSAHQRLEALRAIYASVHQDFQNDAVVEHLGACIEELERITGQSAD
jgi:hypothetical protein